MRQHDGVRKDKQHW